MEENGGRQVKLVPEGGLAELAKLLCFLQSLRSPHFQEVRDDIHHRFDLLNQYILLQKFYRQSFHLLPCLTLHLMREIWHLKVLLVVGVYQVSGKTMVNG